MNTIEVTKLDVEKAITLIATDIIDDPLEKQLNFKLFSEDIKCYQVQST